MRSITVAGAGAFGTALAVVLAKSGRQVTLVGRDPSLIKNRISTKLPGIKFPEALRVDTTITVGPEEVLLLAVPMQQLTGFLAQSTSAPFAAVACCKGIDLETGRGPTAILREAIDAPSAILTGPSFAADIARGLPTALTLATADLSVGGALQETLSTETLRLYLSSDPTGAELGGALKNVIAIACGITIGAGLGESARAALMTRGFAEMQRLAITMGAKPETLSGLSGFGDLSLTCTSNQSRNFSFGHAIGSASGAETPVTVEGRATAKAVVELAKKQGIEMPIAQAVCEVLDNRAALPQVLEYLLNRPLRKE